MARSSETFTQQEYDAFNRFCAKHNIINSRNDEASAAFGDLIGSYIAVTWGQDLTDQTLEIALQKLQEAGHTIPFKSSGHIKLEKVTAETNPALVQAFGVWFERQTVLENQGEQGFSNAAAILSELRG